MPAEAVVTCVARPYADMVLTLQFKHASVFLIDEFGMHVPFQYWEMIENWNELLSIFNKIQHVKG